MESTRLHQLFTAMYSENEGERNAAASALIRHMRSRGLHPSDLVLEERGERHVRTERLLKKIDEDIARLQRENTFYRDNADDKLRAKAIQASMIENRWDEFQALAQLKLGGLKRGWQTRVMKILEINKTRMQNWRMGLARIPDSAFEQLRAATVPSQPVIKRKAVTGRKGKKLIQPLSGLSGTSTTTSGSGQTTETMRPPSNLSFLGEPFVKQRSRDPVEGDACVLADVPIREPLG